MRMTANIPSFIVSYFPPVKNGQWASLEVRNPQLGRWPGDLGGLVTAPPSNQRAAYLHWPTPGDEYPERSGSFDLIHEPLTHLSASKGSQGSSGSCPCSSVCPLGQHLPIVLSCHLTQGAEGAWAVSPPAHRMGGWMLGLGVRNVSRFSGKKVGSDHCKLPWI